MKKYIPILLILFSIKALAGIDGDMTVKVVNIYPVQGEIYIALYSDKSSYLNADSAYSRSVRNIDADTVVFTFSDVPAGTFAIAIFQDLNGNGIFDTNEFGIPTEPFGFSNDPKGIFGPPDFQRSSFDFQPGQKIIITMINQPPGKSSPVQEEKDKKTRKERKKTKKDK